MGSDETKSTLETENSNVQGSCTTKKCCWMTQFVLRFVLFAATLISVVVMVTSKQTKNIFIPGTPIRIPSAKFTNSPALIYFVVALSVACFYSIVSTLVTISAFRKPSSSAILLLSLAIMDVLMVGIVASATGAGGGVAYIGLKGNKDVRWGKICHIYDKFCRHIGSAIAVSLVASIILILLSIISMLSLYKKIR
ncbi:CASP-like protein 1D1 [Cardamine amara subsp. amara]|uniref:CASP-like protein n=1 Tax=Cardamine amara subsp. amara TaxID=228776 RepID=A0ABD1BTR3_CARAN